MRIIVVEDEKITRQWVKRQIEKLRPDYYLVETFANGKEALDYIELHGADVLFTDIRMPVMDGLALLCELQRRENGAYKVILSAYDEFQYAQQALRLGANEFTLKPEITGEELKRILEEAGIWLEKQSRAREEPENTQEQKETWMRQMLEQCRETEPAAGAEKREKEIREGLRRHGIGLDDRNLRAVCLSFPGAVPREKVMELLQLFWSEEKVNYFCLQLGVQSFGIFFNQEEQGTWEESGGRLWELLKIHIGTDVYLGVSDPGDGYGRMGELCRQAAAAGENRRFFGISGRMDYSELRIVSSGKEVKEILEAVEARDFGLAKARTEAFFEEAGKAQELRPACIIAPGREILTGYMRGLRGCPLNSGEYERLRQCELLLGKPVFCFRQFAEEILSAVDFLTDALERKEKHSGFSPAVQKIMQYVEEHYGERISLEQVAAAAFLSRSYASVLFKKETGEKFSDYLQRVRIEKSCGLLRDGGVSIQETAERTGFFDAAHFSRVFKEKMGISPLEYKKKGQTPRRSAAREADPNFSGRQ